MYKINVQPAKLPGKHKDSVYKEASQNTSAK